jgi:hypothetical protein
MENYEQRISDIESEMNKKCDDSANILLQILQS